MRALCSVCIKHQYKITMLSVELISNKAKVIELEAFDKFVWAENKSIFSIL